MPNPLVSIVIPVYNGSNYLREAVDSALTQTYENCEIIVVNDGSTDNTEEICMVYGDKIRYFKKENGGVATALNLGIEQMRGEYFSWLSHDDIYYPDKIEKQIDALHKCGNVTRIVYGSFDLLDQSTGNIQNRHFSEFYSIGLLCDSVFPVVTGLISGCAMLIHRSHFDRVGIFKTELRYTQDYDLWFRMLRGQQLVYLDEPMYIMRGHIEQGTKTASDKMHIEEAALWHYMARSLSREEATRMFGSPYEFYRKMYIHQTAFGERQAMGEVLQLVRDASPPSKSLQSAERVKQYLVSAGKSIARNLCIFCAGVYGLRIFYELQLCDIKVDYFADNDPKKHGAMIADGIQCLTFDQLSAMKDDTLVIVANRFPDAIVKQLIDAEFPFVTTKQEIDRVLELKI